MPCPSCKSWLTGTNFFVYFSHFLSAWGDRMWSFGVGLFLINISPNSLQLTAVYGLTMGASILLFGALIGDIVDESPRLKAAQTALILQNLFVVICAVVIYLYLVYRGDIVSVGGWTSYAAYALIITLSVLSRLTSIARKIAVENDWIVEMCGKDFDKLATMTASLRRIDLATQILAPIATGAVMTVAGVEFGALFIGGWNLCSVVVEYYFLWKVYNTVPALRKKKNLKKSEAKAVAAAAALVAAAEEKENAETPAQASDNPEDPGASVSLVQGVTDAENALSIEVKVDGDNTEKAGGDKEILKVLEAELSTAADDTELNIGESKKQDNIDNAKAEPGAEIAPVDQPTNELEVKPKKRELKCRRLFHSLERLYRGWPVYARYDVVHAGMGLACLYMTVLGLDSVTVGYSKMQGVSEGLVGVMMGVAASFGIFGTFMYPVMRRRIGLPRTGMFGLSLEVMSLLFCVVSVWMPGSPFDLSLGFGPSAAQTSLVNCTQDASDTVTYNTSHSTVSSLNVTNGCPPIKKEPDSYLSIWMLLAGIVTARFGLWVADLSISQLFMERVVEHERGKVNGVQSSLNQLMDMLKFLMVVLAPYEHQFGLLVLISFSFICLGWLLYAFFLRKNRGHFFHFEKCVVGCGQK